MFLNDALLDACRRAFPEQGDHRITDLARSGVRRLLMKARKQASSEGWLISDRQSLIAQLEGYITGR